MSYDNGNELETTNRVLLELSKNQKENNKSLLKVLIINMICYTLLLMTLIIGFFVYESQFDIVYGTETEDAIETITETTTQEVFGENSNINNVEGNQYNDNAVHNE